MASGLMLRLVLTGGAALLTAASPPSLCLPFCMEACTELNGDVHVECAACDDTYACNPAALAFERNRVVAVNTLGDNEPAREGASGNSIHSSSSSSSWRPGEEALDGELATDTEVFAKAHGLPVAELSHPSFPARWRAYRLIHRACAAFARTHSLEGPECLAVGAAQIESHDISHRWVGVQLVEALLLSSSPSLGGTDEGGGSFNASFALAQYHSRLTHWQPGTRWMAIYAAASLGSPRGALGTLSGNMDFPGIGLLAAEILGAHQLVDEAARQAAAGDVEGTTRRTGSSPLLVDLLANYTGWLASGEASSGESASASASASGVPLADLEAAHAEYEAAFAPEADVEEAAFDHFVTRPHAMLSEIRAAGAAAAGEGGWTVAAASLCMRYAKGHDEDVLPQLVRGKQQYVRWEAVLTLPSLLSGATAPIIQVAATNLLEGSLGMSPHAIMNRYTGFKVLAMLLRWHRKASEDDDEENEATAVLLRSIASCLSDEVDVLKLQSGDVLAAALPPSRSLPFLRPWLHSSDAYTRFAAGVAAQKAAARCTDPTTPRAVAVAVAEDDMAAVEAAMLHGCSPEGARGRASANAACDLLDERQCTLRDARWGLLGKHLKFMRAHVLAQMRVYPQEVRWEAFRTFTPDCAIDQPSRLRSRGALLLRGLLSSDAINETRTYFHNQVRVARNESGRRIGGATVEGHAVQYRGFMGRETWSGGMISSHLDLAFSLPILQKELDGLAERMHAAHRLPAMWRARRGGGAGGESPRPRTRNVEYLRINAAQAKQLCDRDDAHWSSCGAEWHVDGGDRPYKAWLMLEAPSERAHSNIQIAPLDGVAALARHLAEVNHTYRGPRTFAWPEKAFQLEVHHDADEMANGTTPADSQRLSDTLERMARQLDIEALDSLRCTVMSEPGDVLLWYPEIFHRTQDLMVDRLAALAAIF